MSRDRIAIVGGGLSGLSTAYLLGKKYPSAEIIVFESESKPGGTIQTRLVDGCTLESGPNGFLSGKPSTLKLADELGLNARLIDADKAAEKRYIYKSNGLVQLPESPPSFFKSSLLPWWGRLAIMKEPFVPRVRPGQDETIAQFGQRRLGRSAVKYLLDPMVSGVFAGNVQKLSLKSCFPRMEALESEYGSLVKAMLKLKSKKASPKGHLVSFLGGMFDLIDALVNKGAFALKTDTPVKMIREEEGRFYLGAQKKSFDTLIFACPTVALSHISYDRLFSLKEAFASVVYPPVILVSFLVPKGAVEGFGYLIPSSEKRSILGALYNSNIFPVRGVVDKTLVTVLMGGDHRPDIREWDDARCLDVAKSELIATAGLAEDQVSYLSQTRWNKSIPQYYQGHSTIVDQVHAIEENVKNLYFTGNAFYGIGINDCTQASYDLVERL
jgi:protoporphyrinogen/coproporphyrinogen III oxidase